MNKIPTTVKNKDLVKERREQIIHTAISLFSKKGFHKTTLRDLAQKTGISHGNIYDYVSSKEDILFLIHEFLHNNAMEVLKRSIYQIQDPFEKLRRMIKAQFAVMYTYADAILLLHRESYVLNKQFLHKLLDKERKYLEEFEKVIQECAKEEWAKSSSIQLISNLIKAMLDACVLKRWDLRRYTTPQEAEKAILNIISHGLLDKTDFDSELAPKANLLRGKSVLVVNGATPLGTAIYSFFTSKGATVASWVNATFKKGDISLPVLTEFKEAELTSDNNQDAINVESFKQMENNIDTIDLFVQDLSTGYEKINITASNKSRADVLMESNLRLAQNMSAWVGEKMSKKQSGRIIFLAPWAWDSHYHLIRYETVKAGTIALTRSMAQKMARHKINVNCIVPGFIQTTHNSSFYKKSASILSDRVPFGSFVEISDVLETILFLFGDGSKHLTGQVLEVGGCL